MELNEHLSRTADRIVADGTQVESRTLHLMASAAQDLNPGAAAALVDWGGSEIARLRAFGIVHGVLLPRLPAVAQAELLTHLLGTSSAIVLDPARLVVRHVDSALITAGTLSVTDAPQLVASLLEVKNMRGAWRPADAKEKVSQDSIHWIGTQEGDPGSRTWDRPRRLRG